MAIKDLCIDGTVYIVLFCSEFFKNFKKPHETSPFLQTQSGSQVMW